MGNWTVCQHMEERSGSLIKLCSYHQNRWVASSTLERVCQFEALIRAYIQAPAKLYHNHSLENHVLSQVICFNLHIYYACPAGDESDPVYDDMFLKHSQVMRKACIRSPRSSNYSGIDHKESKANDIMMILRVIRIISHKSNELIMIVAILITVIMV